MLFLSTAGFFQNNFFFQKFFFRNTIRVSNGLEPDQNRQYVGPDLVPNPLQKIISSRQKLPLAWNELSYSTLMAMIGTIFIHKKSPQWHWPKVCLI